MNITVSPEILARAEHLGNSISAPTGFSGGATVDQAVATLFANESQQEVTLLAFDVSGMPEQRQKSVTNSNGEKFSVLVEDKYQWRGIASIKVGDTITKCRMHVTTAASFGASAKRVLVGQTGSYVNGKGTELLWLSLTPTENAPDMSACIAWLRSNIKTDAPKQVTKPTT